MNKGSLPALTQYGVKHKSWSAKIIHSLYQIYSIALVRIRLTGVEDVFFAFSKP